jgi:hypothetical protein
MPVHSLAVFAVICTAMMGWPPAVALEVQISADGITRPAGTTLVSFLAPRGLDPLDMLITLKSEEGKQVIAQREASSPSLLSWLLEAPLEAGETRRYEIIPGVTNEFGTSLVQCRSEGDDFELTINDKPALLYNAGVKACPEEGFAACQRSGFIHPVYAADGAIVTDDFPPEHPHQHGIMLAWVDSVFDGKGTDFWNSMKNQGTVEHVEVLGILDGPVYGELEVRLRHMQTKEGDINRPVLDENWRIRVYNSDNPRIIDLQSTITCATDRPLHLNEYHYGGMAFRGAREWSFGKAYFLTSEGKDRKSGNHTRPGWTAISGRVDDKEYTVVGIESPTNFRYPQPVRLHPDMPYFCWSPSVLGAFDITFEKPYVSQYRFFVFEGEPRPDVLDTLQANIAKPMMAKVVE